MIISKRHSSYDWYFYWLLLLGCHYLAVSAAAWTLAPSLQTGGSGVVVVRQPIDVVRVPSSEHLPATGAVELLDLVHELTVLLRVEEIDGRAQTTEPACSADSMHVCSKVCLLLGPSPLAKQHREVIVHHHRHGRYVHPSGQGIGRDQHLQSRRQTAL
jgi:hypothetical protein